MTSSTVFTKLFAGILDSTVWSEPDRTRLVWLTMLAMADQYGRVMGSAPGLAHRARVPLEDARVAIRTFLSPDPDSRTKDFEGRRIEEVDGGWRLLNHGKYRELRCESDRREQNRLAQARLRERRLTQSLAVSGSQQASAESAHAEAEEEAEGDEDTAQTKKVRYRTVARPASRTLLVDDLVGEGVDRQHAIDWLNVRKAKRLPLTPSQLVEIKAQAAKANLTLGEAIRVMASKSWVRFEASWCVEPNRAGARNQAPVRTAESTQMYQQRIAAENAAREAERHALVQSPSNRAARDSAVARAKRKLVGRAALTPSKRSDAAPAPSAKPQAMTRAAAIPPSNSAVPSANLESLTYEILVDRG